MKRIYFTVTNDLSFDQRMHRICTSLANAGYQITLVGRRLPKSLPLPPRAYQQRRLKCFFNTGFLFYGEYNLRLLAFLWGTKMDGICAIDLDTILPCLIISKIKGCVRVYDAHEYFTELKEVRTRPIVKKFWLAIERFAVPKFVHGYTVSQGLADEFKKNYNRQFAVIRNLPLLQKLTKEVLPSKTLLYLGAVNEGRCFEILIPAMKAIPYKLIVCGDGNFMGQLKRLIIENNLTDKVELKGMLLPEQLQTYALQSMLGLGLAEKEGINQYYALPNKFLEYMHAGLPQIAMDFPEYRRINNRFKVAVLLDNLTVDKVATTINATMADGDLLRQMHAEALRAREEFCWQHEEQILIQFYKQIFSCRG